MYMYGVCVLRITPDGRNEPHNNIFRSGLAYARYYTNLAFGVWLYMYVCEWVWDVRDRWGRLSLSYITEKDSDDPNEWQSHIAKIRTRGCGFCLNNMSEVCLVGVPMYEMVPIKYVGPVRGQLERLHGHPKWCTEWLIMPGQILWRQIGKKNVYENQWSI